ncbi:biotin--[acetyl-CoA-carboxylase] ligase [archaeon 13_1_20CM_2_54_9]|nr:MAG: biotin--[acetyl-CoA-carboxylase] ligase [Crenarchaeota archaeon 13_1_40CM_3_53_5]OLE77325.1 MAG: biotin--[acetyl-CoA-carboxylase] ligase [archaeon 13_1_20CM_2_54_9]TMI26678.1 MAG: biotin--[acetyl-CoA-carboxylase] ligase [Candidatus Bathyarchaeota archaeon]TMI30527.1 MAG: biotin--[acetyl-CoA-carboxylase] ligase [Candidatus Bathyarchaeota archaeon]
MRILHFEQVESTNTLAYRLAEENAADWTVVSAAVQTKGRGRFGKTWESVRGGLWFSVILRPQVPVDTIRHLQFLAGNSVCEGVEKNVDAAVLLKWPNDLILNAHKLGGILLESKVIGRNPSFVVLGIGVNVNQPKEELPGGATSIFASTGRMTNLGKLLASILEGLRENYGMLVEPDDLLKKWWERCQHRSRTVQVENPGGIIRGVNVGIDGRGYLVVKALDGSVETVEDGTLRIVE